MNSKKLFYILVSCLVVVGLAIIGLAFGADKILTKQSSELANIKAKSQALNNQELQLNKNKKDIAKYSELNSIAKAIVPQDKDQAEAVQEIVSLAKQSGINQLSSISFPASTLGAITKTGVISSGGITQVTPVKGIPGVYDLQITVTQDSNRRVSYSQFISFLSRLENNRRTAQVSSISIQPDPLHPDQVAFTLIIDEFIKP